MERLRSRRLLALGTLGLALVAAALLAVAPADAGRTKVKLSARVSGAVTGGAVSVRASCLQACAAVRGAGTVSGSAIGTIALAPTSKPMRAGRATLALRIPASARGKVNAALSRGEHVTASLRVTALDAAGRALVSASGRVQLGS
jgi:hypothetical protein